MNQIFRPRAWWPPFTWRCSREGDTQWSVRRSMACLVAACIVPSTLMSLYFVVSGYHERKAHALRDAVAIARSVGAGVDRDLASVQSGLRVLAAASALRTDDLQAFDEQARAALASQNITNFVLLDTSGHQRVNTLQPYGAPLPGVGGPPQLRHVFDSHAAVVSDLFVGPVTRHPIVAIGVPVDRDGQTRYSLNAGIEPERVAATLRAQRLPRSWIAGVIDSRGRLVARTHEMQRFVGHLAVPALVAALQRSRDGIVQTTTLDGLSAYTAFSHSSVSDWTFAVAIPTSELTAGLLRQLIWLLLIDTALMALALGVAWRLALITVARPADRLLERMHRVTQNDLPDAQATRPRYASREFAALDRGFDLMCERLRQRDAEREALRQAQTARTVAEAANRAKSEFLSRVSHELRTPLNAVLGFAQLLRLQKPRQLNEQQFEMVGHIEASGRHLLDMINDVLDVSRIEAGTLRMVYDDVDAAALARECVEASAAQAEQAGVRLDLQLHEPVRGVRGDRTRIKQVLLNLLSNAVKYNRPGGQVSLSLASEGGRTWFRVRDSGLGMTPEQLSHLFEPFNRLGRECSTTPGTGIGLVICKHLVEAMGGELSASSSKESSEQSGEQGSEFAFHLPAVRDAQ